MRDAQTVRALPSPRLYTLTCSNPNRANPNPNPNPNPTGLLFWGPEALKKKTYYRPHLMIHFHETALDPKDLMETL